MTPGAPWLDPARCRRALDAQDCRWGEPLVAVPTTTSTNDLALAAEREGAPEGATYVAREQTRGRGRRGNPWWAAAGDNLTFSVLLRPQVPAAQAHALPLIVGLAVREMVSRRLGVSLHVPPVLLKWPNDVWVGSRKIAGVLVESRLRGDQVSAAIVGIGLNVHTLVFPEDLLGQATSLARELRPRRASSRAPVGPREVPRGADLETDRRTSPEPDDTPALLPLAEFLAFEDLLAELLGRLQARYERFLRDGLESFLPELSEADALRGRAVRIDELEGIAAGITGEGALRLCDLSGQEHAIHAGHVTLLDR